MVKKVSRILLSATAVNATLISFACATNTQETPSPASETADNQEIVVRAQRRAQDVIAVPVQVSSMSSDALAKNDVKTLADIGDRIPNTYFGSNSGYGTPAFSIRGVGGTLSTGGEEPVAIFFDDQFIPRTFPGQLLDVESVEVLRGPQVSLYGRNATAGAILLRSARPDLNEVTGYARAQWKSYNEENIEGAVSVPVSDSFAVRAAGLYNHSGGWVTNTYNGKKMNRSESGRGRISALWKPTDRFELYGNFEYGTSDFGIARAGIADRTGAGNNRVLISEAAFQELLDGRYASNSPIDNYKRDARATLTATWKFDGFDLIAGGGYYFTKFGGSNDSDGTAQNIFYNSGQLKFKTYTGDLRLVSTTHGKFDWIVGLSAIDDTYGMPYFKIANVAANTNARFASTLPATAYAIYAEGTYKITNRLSLTVGGRYTYERKKAAVDLQVFNLTTGASIVGPFDFSGRKSWEAFKPRGILQYALADKVNLYASVSTGFKSGGFNAFALAAPYNSENIVSYEGGVKGRFFDNMLTASTAYFHYDYSNLQLRLGLPAGGTIITNAADAKIDGFEFETTFNAHNGLELFASASALNARFGNYVTRDLSGNLVNAAGNQMSRAPKFSMSLGGSYEHPISSSLYARLGANMTHRSRVFFFETDHDEPTIQGAALTNVGARFTIGRANKRWDISAFVKNLTNNVEVTQIELQGNFPIATFSEPRRFGVEFSTRF